MKKLLTLCAVFLSSSAFAGSGYTFLSVVDKEFGLPLHVSTFILVAFIIVALGFVYRLKTAGKSDDALVIPDKGISYRNVIEYMGEAMYNLCVQIMDEERAARYFKFACFLFLFIFLSNIIGLIPGFSSPTDNMNTTFALGIFTFVYYNIKGCQAQGVGGHIKHFMGPIWWLAPLIFVLEIVSHSIRPLSLALRLRGNISGDHMVLAAFADISNYILPIPAMVLGIFVCFMQAFVFTILSVVYIGLSTEVHDHDHH